MTQVPFAPTHSDLVVRAKVFVPDRESWWSLRKNVFKKLTHGDAETQGQKELEANDGSVCVEI